MKVIKRKKILLVLLFTALIVLAPFVLAAGGGGGGGGGGGSSTPASYSDLECNDAGAITFTRVPKLDTVRVENSADGSIFENIAGGWDDFTFTSEEAIFVDAGNYVINDEKFGTKTFTCPGLVFSCKLASITLNSCSYDSSGKITASFTMKDVQLENLKFQFSQTGKQAKLTYEQFSKSKELQNMQIMNDGTIYTVSVENAPAVDKLQLSIPECVGKYYRYATIDCLPPAEQPAAAVSGETLKCGGYLEVRDRVQCRLRLREEQKNEYENFFPEECHSWEDQEKCVALYRLVQGCWRLPANTARIACLRGKVGITTVVSEKAACRGDAGCLTALRENVYTLIKLRLYNLEETAEELTDEGKITEAQLTDFVVKMEESKSAFNQAQTKEERRAVILQARKYWIELMQQVQG